MPNETNHSILRVCVESQLYNYRSPASASTIRQSWGSAWVCDALQLAACQIPFIPETLETPSTEELQEMISSLNIKRSAKNQFPIIVTNAHVIEGMKQCSVQLEGDTRLSECKLLCVFPSRDLAILLPPDRLIDTLICSEISMMVLTPGTQVKVYGYPKNGQGERSLTEGSLSRIINGVYAHTGISTLEYEMSATLNGGNSGGPVTVQNSRGQECVVAIAHQHQTNAANQFNSIPVFHLVADFRDYIRNKKSFGLLSIALTFRSLQHESDRNFHHLDPNSSDGVIVTSVSKMYDTPFKPGDIILKIEDYSINSEGKISLFSSGRVPFSNYIHFLPPYSEVRFTIRRNGEDLIISYNLVASFHSIHRDTRLPNQDPPRFYKHGLLFCGEVGASQIAKAYPGSNGGTNMSPRLYTRVYEGVFKRPETQGTVVFFPFTNTQGYSLEEVNIVTKVKIDGCVHKIRDIFHLANLLRHREAISATDKSEHIAFYQNIDDEVPSVVFDCLSEEDEKKHREKYNIDERFTLENFIKKYLSKTPGWQLVRSRVLEGFFKQQKSGMENPDPINNETPDTALGR